MRTFLLRLPPGDYRPVISDLPNGYVVRAVRADGRDITNGILTIAAESPVTELTVALFPAPGAPWTMVQGRILNAATRTGLGAQGIFQSGLSAPTSIEMTNAAVSEPWKASVRADGTFELPQILPGTYQLRAIPDSSATRSVRVVIPASTTHQLNVTVPDLVPVRCGSC